MSRVPELMAAGVNVAFGHDYLMDPWYGIGSGNMPEVANMGSNAAKAMHLQGYGLEPGCDASFVLLQARDTIEAIQLRANRLKVWKKGTLVAETAETAEVVARLRVAGRQETVVFANNRTK